MKNVSLLSGDLNKFPDNLSSNSDCTSWTEYDLKLYVNFSFWFEIVIINSVSIIGLIINIIGIISLSTQTSMRNVFNKILIILLCTDSAFLLIWTTMNIFEHCLTSTWIFGYTFPYVLWACSSITLHMSIFLTVALSHERYVAAQNPIIHRQQMTSEKSQRLRLLKYVIPILVCTIAFNVPKFMQWSPNAPDIKTRNYNLSIEHNVVIPKLNEER